MNNHGRRSIRDILVSLVFLFMGVMQVRGAARELADADRYGRLIAGVLSFLAGTLGFLPPGWQERPAWRRSVVALIVVLALAGAYFSVTAFMLHTPD